MSNTTAAPAPGATTIPAVSPTSGTERARGAALADRRGPAPAVSLITPLITTAQLALAEGAAGNVERSRRLALRVTSANDWVDVAGKPHLNHSGSMKIAALFGVSLTGMRVEETREKLGEKEVLRYVARTTARFLGREVEVEGVASSDESFFGRRDGRALPLSEVNLNAVRKKAVTNAQGRAVKAILGLGGLTWKEVEEAGVRKCGAPAVASRPAGSSKSSRQAASTPVKTRLANRIFELAAFEDVPLERVLRRYTEFKGDDGQMRWASSVEQMSDAWVERTLERVERDWRSVPSKPPPAPKPAARS